MNIVLTSNIITDYSNRVEIVEISQRKEILLKQNDTNDYS